ncbi:MAG: hypothetical protein A3K06_03860 [Candidatus Doudnabacteria bacterium RIFCSPHIGHO2_01_52_17]|uniref:Uncharacterized protein n=1 Tax=Candidatus Doudnabacteria bacterium RIFCSPHIGHO2_01_52_17 TaxID=1817820 RepID=A0A1F5NAA6_9BACT|nr:MAG: hypothetical protein A3K06_03860 [Candidatus Doudnabacteria bacterium RIFCSPHIGHO2_01_52_17]
MRDYRDYTKQPKKILAESLSMMASAFALVAALAWNEAIKSLIERLVPKEGNNILSLFIYAAVVTILVVIVTSRLAKLKVQLEERPEDKEQ